MKKQQKTKLFYKYTISLFLLFILTSCTPSTIKPNKEHKKNIITPIPSSSRLGIDLFVMSKCPYAIETEKAIIPVIKKFKDHVDFNIYFIAEENDEKFFEPIIEDFEEFKEQKMDRCYGKAISDGGKFKSLHRQSEIDENIRQVVMARYYPEKYLDYLLLRSENYSSENWQECAVKAWMDCEFISQIAQTEEGEMLFRQNINRSNKLKINASPTLLINSKRYEGQINQFGISRMICKELSTNEFCKTIPVCGTDSDCRTEGKVGICDNPDKPEATCKFIDPVNFRLTVINPPDNCSPCVPEKLLRIIKDLFPGVEIEELDNNSAKAEKLINDLNIKELPALYFDKNITQAARYWRIKDSILEINNRFLLDSKHIGITYVLNREEKQGNIKLFVESMSPRAIATENFLIEDGFMHETFINIHYIAGEVNSQGKKKVEVLTVKRDRDNPGILHLSPKQEKVILKSPKGLKEIQEDIRQICINKYYSERHLDYLSCINEDLGKDEGTIDWRQCFLREGIDHQKIENCTNGREGINLLLKDISLVNELGISQCPSYLINNNVLLKGIDPLGFKTIYAELTHQEKQ